MMARPYRSAGVALGVGLLFSLSGCGSRAELEVIKQNQKEILTKLEEIAKRPAAAAAPARPQRPRGPDPKKVYAFPVNNSPSKGKANAWVTVIEVSDFQ